MSDLTVACVYWEGSFRNRPYTREWPAKLKRMVSLRLRPHRFVCMSNVDVPGVETLPLVHNWPGWWSKIELFRPGNGLDGRVLYLDLDTLIVDEINSIADFDSPFALMPSYHRITGGKAAGGPGIVDRYQSSCMVFDAGAGEAIYNRFAFDVASEMFRGDQDWIGHIAPDLDTLPGKWFRKLRDCTDGPRKDVRVVLSMPWKNDTAAKQFEWVRDIWG